MQYFSYGVADLKNWTVRGPCASQSFLCEEKGTPRKRKTLTQQTDSPWRENTIPSQAGAGNLSW